MILGSDGVADPGTKVIKLDDAATRDGIVVGPGRFEIVVALVTSSHSSSAVIIWRSRR